MTTQRIVRPVGRRGSIVLLAAVAVLATVATACRPQPQFTVSTVVSGLSNPWDIGFAPNGSIFFTERAGRIGLRTTTQQVRTIATPADAVQSGEGGMMGIAVDPGFNSNRRVYACFLSNASGALDVRIARWQLNQTATALVGRTDILTGMPVSSGRHSGCRIRFGPDGHLWVGTGDAAIGTNPQNPNSLGGKVLRITTNGAPAPGNAGAPFRPEIYTYGHRNVQGLAFAADGTAYSIEHGPDRDDEVNRLVRGGNYGWDPVPGYNESVPMTDTAKFPNAIPAVWSSGSPTIAPSGGVILSGSQWQGWDRALAMAVLKGRQLRVVGLTPDGTAVEVEWTVLTDRGRLRSAAQGPDGNLYVATDAGGGAGSILRITPTAPAG